MTGGYDAYMTKLLRNKARTAAGQCTYCPPNRGCCDNNSRDGKYLWPDATFRPSKGKSRK